MGRNRPPKMPVTAPPLIDKPVPQSRWQSEAINDLRQLFLRDLRPHPGELLRALRNLDDDALVLAWSDISSRIAVPKMEVIKDVLLAELHLRIEEREHLRHQDLIGLEHEAHERQREIVEALRQTREGMDSLARAATDAGRQAKELADRAERLEWIAIGVGAVGLVIAVVMGVAPIGVPIWIAHHGGAAKTESVAPPATS